MPLTPTDARNDLLRAGGAPADPIGRRCRGNSPLSWEVASPSPVGRST